MSEKVECEHCFGTGMYQGKMGIDTPPCPHCSSMAPDTLEQLIATEHVLREVEDERDLLKAENDRLAAALEPFAAVAEWDIGDSEADDDIFRPMDGRNAVAKLIRVGDLRRARAALTKPKEANDGDA